MTKKRINTVKMPIDVIIPVFNEENGIRAFYERIQKIPIPTNLIFIDNASTDNSLKILESLPSISIIRHSKNEGYGGSILDGIQHSDGEIIVIIDADGEYPPESIPELVSRLEQADVVYASRFLDKNKVQISLIRRWGNQLITNVFNRLFNQQLTDLYTGFKVLKRSALDGIKLEKKGFEHVLEIGVRFSEKGVLISEVHVPYSARTTDRSKMRHLSETFKFIFLMFYYYFSSKPKS
jgi:glycosyltransferase involved in cell wall biosynthesis